MDLEFVPNLHSALRARYGSHVNRNSTTLSALLKKLSIVSTGLLYLLKCRDSKVFPAFVTRSVKFATLGLHLQRLASRLPRRLLRAAIRDMRAREARLQAEIDAVWHLLFRTVKDARFWNALVRHKDAQFDFFYQISLHRLEQKFARLLPERPRDPIPEFHPDVRLMPVCSASTPTPTNLANHSCPFERMGDISLSSLSDLHSEQLTVGVADPSLWPSENSEDLICFSNFAPTSPRLNFTDFPAILDASANSVPELSPSPLGDLSTSLMDRAFLDGSADISSANSALNQSLSEQPDIPVQSSCVLPENQVQAIALFGTRPSPAQPGVAHPDILAQATWISPEPCLNRAASPLVLPDSGANQLDVLTTTVTVPDSCNSQTLNKQDRPMPLARAQALNPDPD